MTRDMVHLLPIGDSIRPDRAVAVPGGMTCRWHLSVNDDLGQPRYRRIARQQRLECCLVEGCHIDPRSPLSSKSICKASIEKQNLFGRRRLLQERRRDEAGDIQCCQEMLADSPTNL